MAINTGVLKSRQCKDSDEMYTPFYAVSPLVDFIKKGSTVWCPFDEEWSAYVVLLREKGFNVINSHLAEGEDFFLYEPKEYDVIISNPPFSMKDEVLKRLHKLNKPFAILLPLNSLQGKKRFPYVKDLQLLFFDNRVGYHKSDSMNKPMASSPFASAYFCKHFLPKDIMALELNKYERELKTGGI